MLGFDFVITMFVLMLVLVLIELFYCCVVILILGTVSIVHVHHVNKDAFLKGNIEPNFPSMGSERIIDMS
jgi:hypothetical protein